MFIFLCQDRESTSLLFFFFFSNFTYEYVGIIGRRKIVFVVNFELGKCSFQYIHCVLFLPLKDLCCSWLS